MAMTWFISRDGKEHGPITEIEFRKLIELGHLKGTDFVWHEGAPEWMPGTQFLKRPIEAKAARPELARAEEPDRRTSSSSLSKAQSGRPTRRRLLPIVASVVLAGILTVIGKLAIDKVYEGLFRPKADRASIEQQLLADPKMKWLQTLRDRQPTTYSEFMDALTARVQRREPLEDSINYLRKSYVEPIFTASAAHLDDEAMTRYILLVVEQMEVFSQKNPKLCVRMLRGEPLGNVRPYLTESLVAQELQLLDDALRADKTKMMPRYTQVEQDKLMQAAVLKVAQQHGDLVRFIDPATPVSGREQDVCTVGTALFKQIAALPAPSSAALMRSLLNAPK